jgi:hypothetical protein
MPDTEPKGCLSIILGTSGDSHRPNARPLQKNLALPPRFPGRAVKSANYQSTSRGRGNTNQFVSAPQATAIDFANALSKKPFTPSPFSGEGCEDCELPINVAGEGQYQQIRFRGGASTKSKSPRSLGSDQRADLTSLRAAGDSHLLSERPLPKNPCTPSPFSGEGCEDCELPINVAGEGQYQPLR